MAKIALIFLLEVACALAAPSSESAWRIIGGENAQDGDFPYQVSIKQDGNHICGGSIIDVSSPYILTAAHCVYGADISKLTVVMGTNKLNSGGTVYQRGNDIALIRLTQPIKFSENVAPVALETGTTGADVECVLSGWGSTSLENTPNNLQYIKVKTHDLESCKRAYNNTDVFDTDICTLTKKGEGGCFGDSGSPLVSHNRCQIGIVSWGEPPCGTGKPDVFARVESYIDWIEANI